uniref:Uncharacterized protein n=1 Tax=Pithovirus LCPAC304 TaxID=2506594 RepID=A0A481ZAT5_9VIRU|nr:MAG: hypothetical protein LCPAC304_05560 [Pithovirus LCPAC304]
MEAETTSLRSLEDFDEALSKLEESFSTQDLPEECTSLTELRNAVLKDLFPVFGSCNILKIRKSSSKTNCILWLVLQLQDHFIYAVIFHLIWTDEKKGMNMYKKLEEVDVGWIKLHTPKTLNEFHGFIESNECFHYSLTDETSYGIELPCFEKFLSRVSENHHHHHPQQHKKHEKHSVSKQRRHRHQRPQTPPERPLRQKYRTYETAQRRRHHPSPRHREQIQKERRSKHKRQKKKQRSHRLVETVYTSSEEAHPFDARKKSTIDQRWNNVLVKKKPSHQDPSF